MAISRFSFAVLLVVALTSTSANQNASPAVAMRHLVVGTVVAKGGAPLGNVRVAVLKLNEAKVRDDCPLVSTDAAGRFSIAIPLNVKNFRLFLVDLSGQYWRRPYTPPHFEANPLDLGFIQLNTKSEELASNERREIKRLRKQFAKTQPAIAEVLAATLSEHPEPGHDHPGHVQTSAYPPHLVEGVGATFADPLLQVRIAEFSSERPGTRLAYNPAEGEQGIDLLMKRKVDFAATDCPVAPNAGLLEVPISLGAVVPVYNLEGVTSTLRFTPEVLAAIFGGTILEWDDSAIRQENPLVTLPHRRIVIVHRSDGSGTTCVFSKFVAHSGSSWHGGTGFRVRWPRASIGAAGNGELVRTVRQTQDAIGYLDLQNAVENKLDYGAVQNKAGRFVRANPVSISAAVPVDIPQNPDDIMRSLFDAPSAGAYPISSVTWLLVPVQSKSESTSELLRSYLKWGLGEGQARAPSMGYGPLPEPLVQRAIQQIDQIRP